jgi:hypothetical protein
MGAAVKAQLLVAAYSALQPINTEADVLTGQFLRMLLRSTFYAHMLEFVYSCARLIGLTTGTVANQTLALAAITADHDLKPDKASANPLVAHCCSVPSDHLTSHT